MRVEDVELHRHIYWWGACRWVYEDSVNQLRNRYSVWEEAELVTGCIHKWHKLQKRKHRDVSEQIGREMGQLWSRLRADFFWGLVPEVGFFFI